MAEHLSACVHLCMVQHKQVRQAASNSEVWPPTMAIPMQMQLHFVCLQPLRCSIDDLLNKVCAELKVTSVKHVYDDLKSCIIDVALAGREIINLMISIQPYT